MFLSILLHCSKLMTQEAGVRCGGGGQGPMHLGRLREKGGLVGVGLVLEEAVLTSR